MKIALNAIIASSTRTGTGHYAANLAKAMLQIEHENELIIYCKEEMQDWFREQANGKTSIVGTTIRTPEMRIFWEQTKLPQDLKRRDIDLLHSLAFTSPLLNNVKTVVTVHDLAFYYYPETISFVKKLYYRPVFKRSIKSAQRVITVSETVRKELIDAFRLIPESVISVPEAVSEEFLFVPSTEIIEKKCKKLGVHKPYILTVGTLEPRKNLLMLIEAFNLLKKEVNIPHKLTVAGKKGWLKLKDEKNKKLFDEANDIIFTGYIDQEDMPALYAGADFFLFPSLYEGFGLPLLEAFASGVPVITSDIPVHREVCGNAALFINPNDAVQWKEAILSLLDDSDTQNNLKEKGLQRVQEFSWKKAAEKTLEVYGMDENYGNN